MSFPPRSFSARAILSVCSRRDVAATRRDATAVDALGPVLRAEHSEEVPHPVAAPALRIAVWPRALAWTEEVT